MNNINNVLTIDVEDYFHVAALAKSIPVNTWDSQQVRVLNNTKRTLDILDNAGVKATYFVLGWVAERYPSIVKEIAQRGHEVACHGYSHQLVYTQKPDVFKDETVKTKIILEDIIGVAVEGYRAASYSITRESLWALDILAESGFKYDSSIFPVRHDNYGIPGFPSIPHILQTPKGYSLAEYPLSTYKKFGQTLPVAGGGYFRFYPYWLSRYFFNKINAANNPFVFYLHPWEIDPAQPRIKASFFSEFRHYNNLDKCEHRLTKLLTEFKFTTMKNALIERGLLDS